MKRASYIFLLALLVFGLASCSTRRGGKGKGCDCPGFGHLQEDTATSNTTFRV
ncbi:MAG: hypothetical protein H6603_07535 [Flavobacteriales bacterium]|nr:hypothetical protein [Flavobacteriales bacterium]MCB9204815.1 hypothetical protein [Flavobacteriales bacterium]